MVVAAKSAEYVSEAGRWTEGKSGAGGQLQRQSWGMPEGTGPLKTKPEHIGQEEKLMGIDIQIGGIFNNTVPG